jgi:hypothetical protein
MWNKWNITGGRSVYWLVEEMLLYESNIFYLGVLWRPKKTLETAGE